jgi:type IV pilus assembly protein PilN
MIQINLLPVREERRKAGLRQLAALLGAAVVGSLLLVGVLHLKQRGDLSAARQNLASTQKEIDAYKEQLQQVEEFRKTQEHIEQKLGVIERLNRSRSGPVRLLDEIATHAPERLWLTQLSSGDGRMTLEGISLDNEIVAAFASALGGSPYFANVELQETEAAEIEGFKLNRFTLSAALRTADTEALQTAAATAPAGAGR